MPTPLRACGPLSFLNFLCLGEEGRSRQSTQKLNAPVHTTGLDTAHRALESPAERHLATTCEGFWNPARLDGMSSRPALLRIHSNATPPHQARSPSSPPRFPARAVTLARQTSWYLCILDLFLWEETGRGRGQVAHDSAESSTWEVPFHAVCSTGPCPLAQGALDWGSDGGGRPWAPWTPPVRPQPLPGGCVSHFYLC